MELAKKRDGKDCFGTTIKFCPENTSKTSDVFRICSGSNVLECRGKKKYERDLTKFSGTTNTKLPMRKYIGRKRNFFPGIKTKYEESSGKHILNYDDACIETMYFSKEQWKRLPADDNIIKYWIRLEKPVLIRIIKMKILKQL